MNLAYKLGVDNYFTLLRRIDDATSETVKKILLSELEEQKEWNKKLDKKKYDNTNHHPQLQTFCEPMQTTTLSPQHVPQQKRAMAV